MSRGNFLYMKIYDELKKKIEENEYGEGAKLPSDEDLMSRFGVSMITVKKALGMLKDEGLLQRIPGVGTFVERREKPEDADGMEGAAESPLEIGIIMEHVSSSFGLDLLYRIDQKAEEKGFKTIIRFSYYRREKETEEIKYLVKSKIAGLIVMPCHGVYYNPEILKLILEGFPVVVIDKKLEGISVPSVRTDNKQAIITLVRRLSEQGCKRMAFASSEIIGTSSLQERKNGFYEAAGELSVEILPECTLTFDKTIFSHQPNEENIEKALCFLRENEGRIDGIVCAEYSLVPALEEALIRAGGDAAEKIRIGCVDGPDRIPILHMKQNELEMADTIFDLLMARINGTRHQTDYLVPAVLVEGRPEN